MDHILIFLRHRAGFFIVLGAVFALTGCGSDRLRSDYTGYESAYADSSNRQMLLNLARLDQHDPTYFLQFGQINVSYSWNANANVTANDTIPSSRKSSIIGGTASLGGAATTTPSFQFIPVSDDKVAGELLKPVPPDVIYTLFQQGWPVDQLLRLMVERFEIYLPGETVPTTYVNSPARGDIKSYIIFLKICAIAREFQIDGHLKLRGDEEFEPLAKGWSSSKAPEAKDLLDADAKGLRYKQNDKGDWELGRMVLVPSFVLDGNADTTFQRLKQSPVYKEGTSLANMRALLADGFSVEGNFSDRKNSGSRLVLRSFLTVLASSAQEQAQFDATGLNNPPLINFIPPLERQPILQLRWDKEKAAILPPLVALDYHGQTYQVTDLATGKIDEGASWNRDVFRLLTQLTSQVSVDISKFPLPTTLQILSP